MSQRGGKKPSKDKDLPQPSDPLPPKEPQEKESEKEKRQKSKSKSRSRSRSKSPRLSRRARRLPPELNVPQNPYALPTLNPALTDEEEEDEAADYSTASGVDLEEQLEAILAKTRDMAASRAEFDQALAKIKQATIFLKSETERAEAAANNYAATGTLASKAQTEVALQQMDAKFKQYCQRVQEAESIIMDLNLTPDQAKIMHEEVDTLYKAHTNTYILDKVDAEATFKEALKTHRPVQTQPADKLFKLPTLAVPTFTGDIREFAQFQKNFQDIIGSTALRNFQKLIHLKQALKGEAADAVASCGDDDTAYDAAWRILRGRYGDPDVLRSLLLTELSDINPMNDNMLVKEQRKNHDRVRTKFLKLMLVDPDVNQPTSPMRPMIQGKYTRAIRREIEKEKGTALTASEFLDEAEAILRRESRYAATETKKDKAAKPKLQPAAFTAAAEIPVVSIAPTQQRGGKKSDKKGGGAYRGGGGATGAASRQDKSKDLGFGGILLSDYTCPICKSKAAHYVSKCPTLAESQPEDRKKTIKLHGLCERCLRKGHAVGHEKCPFKGRECGRKLSGGAKCTIKKHHPILHF